MIRFKDIQSSLLHLVGWQQSYDTTNISLSDNLTQSESGIFFQQVHPLLTLECLSSVAPDFSNREWDPYVPGFSYEKGMVVEHNEKLYKALADNTDVEPGTNTEYWISTNPFSEWLEAKTIAGIQKAISRFCTEKMSEGTFKALCENKVLFDGTSRIKNTITNRKNLVGFEIIPVRSKGVTLKINKIGLQFTEPGEYTLYLMHSSMNVPVKVITCNKLRKGSMEWFNQTDLYLPYISADNDAGGSWYLCYLQSALPEGSEAVKKDRDWSKGPCRACSSREFQSWQAWSKYLEVHPFYVKEERVNAVKYSDDFNDDFSKVPLYLWDIADNVYTYDSNYGINLEVSVLCDPTDFIIEQRGLFQEVIAKQVGVDLLRELAYNPNARTNRHIINASRTDILYDLDGDSASLKKSGLSYELDLAFKAIKLDTSGADRVCMPCKNNGLKYRVV